MAKVLPFVDDTNVFENALNDWAETIVPGPGEIVVGGPTGPVKLGTTLIPQGITDEAPAINAVLSAAVPAGGTRHVTLIGAFTISQPLIVRSNTVLDLTRATLTLNAGSDCNLIQSQAAYGAGRDSNIAIRFGTIDRGANNGVGNGKHSVVLRNVDGLDIAGGTFTSTGGKYAILLQNVTDFRAGGHTFANTASDGLHIQGPAARGTIRTIRGSCGDDMVAITPKDYATYVWGDEGDVTDITIEDVRSASTSLCLVKVLGGSGVTCRTITVRDVAGASTGTHPIVIGDDTSSANTTGGFLDDIRLERVAVSPPSNKHHIYLNGSNMGRVEIDGFRYAVGAATNQQGVCVNASAVISSLTVEHVKIVDGCANLGAVHHSGNVGSLTIRGVRGTPVASANLLRYEFSTPNAAIQRLIIDDVTPVWASLSGSLVRAELATHVLANLTLTNVLCGTGPSWLGDLNTTTNIFLRNVVTPGGLFNIRANANLTIWTEGANASGATAITSGAVVHSKSLGFSVDVAKLTAGANDLATNTNASLGCGAGPVVSNGTLWKHLYSGSTS